MSNLERRPSVGLSLIACCALFILTTHQSHAAGPKVLGFRDPNTNYLYTLRSANATAAAANPTSRQDANAAPRSLIRVSRVKLDERRQPVGQPESIQTLKFTPALVDFDLHCTPSHCYLVTVTSRTRRNVELFAWQRTQFDLSAVRDSFAKPAAVRLIGINDGFYIAIAQEQLQLSPYRYSLAASDDEEPTRFMGCAVLKFSKGGEHNVKYHQFIRLSFNPRHVNHFTTISSNNATDPKFIVRPTQSHHLVFSSDSNWADPEAGSESSRSFIWSPLNDYFWPYRLPKGREFVQSKPGTQVLKFPELAAQLAPLSNYSQNSNRQDYAGAVEMCFHQLQRLLTDRDLETRRMIDSSKSVWRASDKGNPYAQAAFTGLTNISAQVIVHGNVEVTGAVLGNPQISLIGGNQSPQAHQAGPLSAQQVGGLVKSHSPAIVENKLKLALFKLNYMREKIGHAVPADLLSAGPVSAFMNQVRLFGPIEADEVVFSDVANSDIRLNGIPFRQLENELVSLSGTQKIGARVVFTGKVVADRLEIHGLINGNYHLKDAIDVMSNRLQVIDATSHAMQTPGWASVDFRSISVPEIVLSHNATLNSINLDDFITRDNRTQLVVGRKSFKRLSMSKLDLAHPGVQLNDLNISRIARDAIRLRPERAGKLLQLAPGSRGSTFMKPVFVDKLTLNGKINQHINLTSLIYDSIKANSYQVQQIIGQKNFLNGLKVNRLNTEGALNSVQVSQIFNLNSLPPVPEQQRGDNLTAYDAPHDTLITGDFIFGMPVQVAGSVHANLVNDVDLAARAIRRETPSQNRSRPQLVRGRKTFYRPLRVLDDIRLIDLQQASRMVGNATRIPYPLVNGLDMRRVSSGLARQKLQPPPIFVQNLEIEGNLEIPTQGERSGSIFGNQSSVCPLDLIRSRVVLAGAEDQLIETPLQVNTLRAKNLFVAPGALNGLNFPADFVLRTTGPVASVEHIHGVKTIQHMIVSPATQIPSSLEQVARQTGRQTPGVVFGHGSSINEVRFTELQSFIGHEHNFNSTGEKVFKTMNVYGNIYSRRINGHEWPDDILLRSASSNLASSSAPSMHKRIYSHLVFTNTSNLHVDGQLVLRGPIQLDGRMNGVNLTEFSRQSATYGDKDLYSMGRPIRNKIFLGGITVKNGIRSDGLINGVNFEEMKQRVVTIQPSGAPTYISSPKIFTDVSFEAPIRMNYLNGVPIDNYLNMIRFEPDGVTLRIPSKKVITGALRINRNLFVQGLINGVDFTELKARAISLAPSEHELVFNKTLIVEGDVFMDNLWIDERNGTIDGVKLRNLLRVGPQSNDEFAITDPTVMRLVDPYGRLLRVSGTLMDCQVTCDARPALPPARNYASSMRSFQQLPLAFGPTQSQPITIPTQSVTSFTSRPTIFNHNSLALTRTTPPYSLASSYQTPIRPTPRPTAIPARMVSARMLQLGNRQPVSVRYEQRKAPGRRLGLPAHYSIVDDQLEALRKQIVSVNLVRLSREQNLIVGFIDAPHSDIAHYQLPEADLSHNDHTSSYPSSYLQLDQIDFKFKPTTYHLSVGVSTTRLSQNVTSVHASLGVSNSRELMPLTILPVEAPNSAKFFDIPNRLTLFLLISQDRFLNTGLCYASDMSSAADRYREGARNDDESRYSRVDSGIHVYLFHPLLNSSSFNSAYFDLHQTLDLIGIDGFERFTYKDSSYVLAISREFSRIHLLLLRGYTGFQQVSYIDTPMIESVSVLQSNDERPVLVIRQTSGSHRVMEAVVI